MATDGTAPDGAMTLVLELSAARRLAEPTAAFDDARRWSRYVGIVSNDPDAVAAFVREHDLEPDVGPAGRDKWLAMSEIRASTGTPRHVFVGTSTDDRRLADHVGWEYLPLSEAAEKAGWELEGDRSAGTSLVDRLRRLAAESPLSFGRR